MISILRTSRWMVRSLRLIKRHLGQKHGEDQGLGKSRGGNTSKVHAAVDGLGRCIDFIVTGGHVHDSTQACVLLEGITGDNVIADKAYDSNEIRAFIEERGSTPVIPSRSCRLDPIEYDTHIYKERHLVECFFQFIKRFRRIGTRYEKTKVNFEAMVTLGCILQWIIF